MTDRMHPRIRWLEAELPGPLSGADFREHAVVAPSAPAADSLREAVLRRGRALLGVHFVTAPALARLVLERCGAVPPARRADPLVEREALRSAVAGRRGPASRYAARFPGALRQLLAAVREWQQAGWPPCGDGASASAQEVLEIARDFDRQTAHLATRSRLMRAALAALSALDGDGRADLPRRVLCTGFVSVPGDLASLLDELAARGVEVLHAPADGAAAARPRPVEWLSAADPEKELRLAARLCLRHAAAGVPWRDMVVAAPRLGGYVAHIRRAFCAEGVPFRASAQSPLLREPRGALCWHAARLLFDDAPRLSLMALIGSELLRDPTPPEQQLLFDEMSRAEYLHGRGTAAREFLALLRQQLDARLPDARPVAAWHLEQWLADADAVDEGADVATRAKALADFLRRHVAEPAADTRDARVQERLDEVLDVLRAAWPGGGPDGGPRDGGAFVRELEDLLSNRGLPISGSAEGEGVHVVEFDDAVAYPAAHLHLLGLSAHGFPEVGPSEVFFADADRRRIEGLCDQEQDRRAQEDLLGALLRLPTVGLALSRPRRDADGRPAGPTSWLPRIAAALGGGELTEQREPAHPIARARARIAAGESCPRDLALSYLALTGAGPDALAEVAGPEARALWSTSRLVESFDPKDLRRDGDVGPDIGRELGERYLSISGLRTLGLCPHRFLLGTALGVKPLPPEPDPVELPRDRLGTAIHGVLESLFAEFGERLRGAEQCAPLVPELAARSRELLALELARAGGPLQRDFPTLHALLEERWQKALVDALGQDLARMDEDGSRPLRVEHQLRHAVLLDSDDRALPPLLHLSGRLDRVDRLRGGAARIVDFKTGRRPERDVDGREILRGRRPQLAAYALLLAAAEGEHVAEVEVCAVRPQGTGGVPGEPAEFRHAVGPDLLDGAGMRGFVETLQILYDLRGRGALLPAAADPPCGWCEFRAACRRLHPPSCERVDRAGIAEVDRYRRLGEKSARKPLLAAEDNEQENDT